MPQPATRPNLGLEGQQLNGFESSASKHLFPDDHVLGLPSVASVVLLEYGDFCCSRCQAVCPVVKEVCRRMGDRLCFVFRHFPKEHPQAHRAATVAQAASLQGRFWPMYDLLFEQHGELDDERLFDCAGAAGLDIERLEQHLNEPHSAARVVQHRDAGLASGVQTTPTFFINGSMYGGTHDLSGLLHAVQREAGLR